MKTLSFCVSVILAGCCLGEWSGGTDVLNDDAQGIILGEADTFLPGVTVISISFDDSLIQAPYQRTTSQSDGRYFLAGGFPYLAQFNYGSYPHCKDKHYTTSDPLPFLLVFVRTPSSPLAPLDTMVVAITVDSTLTSPFGDKSSTYWAARIDTVLRIDLLDFGEPGQLRTLPSLRF